LLDLFDGLLSLLTALAAFAALWTWRAEMVGRRRAELAEEVLAAFYEAKDAFQAIRSPAYSASELDEQTVPQGEPEELSRALEMHRVVRQRMILNNALFADLLSKKYRFSAVFGKESAAPFDKVAAIRSKLYVTNNVASVLAKRHYEITKIRPADQNLIESMEKYDVTLFGEQDTNTMKYTDEISLDIEKSVLEIERICRPHIEAEAKTMVFLLSLLRKR
jgi:hypothetical protein